MEHCAKRWQKSLPLSHIILRIFTGGGVVVVYVLLCVCVALFALFASLVFLENSAFN